MNRDVRCIMLVDDNHHDNFFHEREIRKANSATVIITKNTGLEALAYLKSGRTHLDLRPDLIFLDINMPGMNGWEFLHEYNNLDKELQSRVVVVMLTASDIPDDKNKVKQWSFVADYIVKPLTKAKLIEIVNKYFK